MNVTPDAVFKTLEVIDDPELKLSIVGLGLVYGVDVDSGMVTIKMGLTTPFCPFQDALRELIVAAVLTIDGVTSVAVEFVLDPPWSPDITKAKEVLDWQPSIDLETGLKKTIAYFQEVI